MNTGDDTVYTARQVSEALGVSTAMVRKYAATYEAITGEPIKQHARDGRFYTRAQLDALVAAKGFVDSNVGMSIDTALKIALGRAEAAVRELQTQPTGIDTAAFAEAILAELRGLRLANERLLERLEALENRQLPSPKPTELEASESAAATSVHGDAVRFGVNDERIDRALEVEMQESRAAQEIPPAAQKVVNTINSVEPQRPEHESWITEVAVQALITASELPGSAQEGRERGDTFSEPQSEADGPMVRAARWLERLLRRK